MSYRDPAKPTGVNPYMVGVQQSQALINRGLKQMAATQERRRQEIQEMQEREYKIDQWKIGQINQLNKLEDIPNVDLSVKNMLASQVNYAAQAQMYLATQFGDDEKRAEARDVITNYQSLLTETGEFAGSWDANTKLWNDKYLSLNQPGGIRLVGDPGTEEGRKELKENQWLLDVLSGRFNQGTSVDVVYDQDAKDLRMNIKGSDINGEKYDKSILGKEWLKLMNSADGYEFIVDVPKGPTVMIEKMQAMTNNEGAPIMNPNKALDESLYLNKPQGDKQMINANALRGLLVAEANQMVSGIVFGAKGNQMPESFYNYTLKQATDSNSWSNNFVPDAEALANKWNADNAEDIKNGLKTAKTSADITVEQLRDILIDQTIASIPNLEVLGEYDNNGVFQPTLKDGKKQYYYKVAPQKPKDVDKPTSAERSDNEIINAVDVAYDKANNADPETDPMDIVNSLQNINGYTFAPSESGDALVFDVFKDQMVTKDGERSEQPVLVDQFTLGDPDEYQRLIRTLNKGRIPTTSGYDTVPKSSQYVNDMIKALEGSSLDKIIADVEKGITTTDIGETEMMGVLNNLNVNVKGSDGKRSKASFKELLEDAGITYREAVAGSDQIGFEGPDGLTKIKIDENFLDNLIKYLRDSLGAADAKSLIEKYLQK
jgi:hypothetical protein